jgi:DNA repair protein RecO (recombination protein O)
VPPPVSERTPALILRSVDFGESDRILHLLVPEGGRLTAIAKGARRSTKRFSGTLDLFNQLRVQIHRGRGLAMSRLDQAILVRHYAPLRTDPARFALGCYLLELLDRLAPEGGAGHDTRRLFRFVLDAFQALSTHRPDPTLRTILELRALDALGLRPELRSCVGCGRELAAESDVHFHVADGGAVCGACSTRRTGLLPVQLGTLRALERGLALEVGQLDRLVLSRRAQEDARRVVERFQRFHVGVELQSQRFLDRMLPAQAPVGGNRPDVPV